jgi:hypothetical protein
LYVTSNTVFTPNGAGNTATVHVTANSSLSNLYVSVGNINLFGNTTISGNSSFRSLLITGNTSVTNVVVNSTSTFVVGNVAISGSLHRITGNVNIDSGVLYVDQVNNRVGVNNTTPDAALTITGAANVSGAVRFANSFIAVGNSSFSNTLTVTGNVSFSNTLAVTGNVIFSNTLSVIGLVTLGSVDVTGTSNFRGATSSNGVFTVANTSSLNGAVTFNTEYVIDVAANGNVGSGNVVIYSYPKATYSSSKLQVQVKYSGNTQLSEMIVAHDNTTAQGTVFGTVVSPAGSELGDLRAAINNANVEITLVQLGSVTGSAVKVVANLIK